MMDTRLFGQVAKLAIQRNCDVFGTQTLRQLGRRDELHGYFGVGYCLDLVARRSGLPFLLAVRPRPPLTEGAFQTGG